MKVLKFEILVNPPVDVPPKRVYTMVRGVDNRVRLELDNLDVKFFDWGLKPGVEMLLVYETGGEVKRLKLRVEREQGFAFEFYLHCTIIEEAT